MWIPFVVPPAVVLVAVVMQKIETALLLPRDSSRQTTIGGPS
jgi:hypothetical protein